MKALKAVLIATAVLLFVFAAVLWPVQIQVIAAALALLMIFIAVRSGNDTDDL